MGIVVGNSRDKWGTRKGEVKDLSSERSDTGGLGGTPPNERSGILHKKRDSRDCPFFCGDGRTRTAVQTKHRRAFYTLILPMVVGCKPLEDGLFAAYLLSLGGA